MKQQPPAVLFILIYIICVARWPGVNSTGEAGGWGV